MNSLLPVSNEDEARTQQFLVSRGLQPERYPGKDSRRSNQTPDFKVSAQDGYFFYCEQKSVFTKTGEHGIAHRTKYNSLTDDIHDAAKKFRSVNGHHLVPNVLVWISYNFQIDDRSLTELLEGKIRAGNKALVNLGRFRYGRVARDLKEIDLHLWLYSSREPQLIFTPFTALDLIAVERLCKIFGIKSLARPA